MLALVLPVSLLVSFIAAALVGVGFLVLGVTLDPTLRQAAKQGARTLHRLVRRPTIGCV